MSDRIKVVIARCPTRGPFGLMSYGALRAGAAGFLLKTAEPGEILTAVRRVAAGDGALGAGQSNLQIAAELFITEATAKTHISRILAKLGCTSRVQAAILAREGGLV